MQKSRYYFYLNPHDEYKWTKCPKCKNQTKSRKYCLMIHYKEESVNFHQLFSLNKSCKFCPYCELIIAQKSEIEFYLSQIALKHGFKLNPNNYFIFGTMDKKDWIKCQKEGIDQGKVLDIVFQFKDVLDFEIKPRGWYFKGE